MQLNIDNHTNINSFLHSLNPKIKLISTIILILIILFSKFNLEVFFAYTAFFIVLIFLSKIPVLSLLKRFLTILPFVLLIAFSTLFMKHGQGIWICAKSLFSVLCMMIFMNTTRLVDLLKAMEELKCPHLIVMVFAFMYRYIFTIYSELMKMKQAKDVRAVGDKKNRWFNTKVMANMIGTLFVRSYEKAENVYLAMCSRGYDG